MLNDERYKQAILILTETLADTREHNRRVEQQHRELREHLKEQLWLIQKLLIVAPLSSVVVVCASLLLFYSIISEFIFIAMLLMGLSPFYPEGIKILTAILGKSDTKR